MNDHHYPDVHAALSDAIQQALEVPAAAQPGGPQFRELPDQAGWERHHQETLLQRTRSIWDHPAEVASRSWWRGLAAYPSFQAALDAHPEVRDRLDALVGFPFSLRGRDLRTILILQMLSPQIEAARGYDFDQDMFDACYRRLEAGVLQQHVRMIEFMPLLGLASAYEPVQLPDGMTLRLMTDLELSMGIQTLGVPVSDRSGTTSLTVAVGNQFALVLEHTFPVQYGAPADPVTMPLALPSFEDEAHRLIDALRLACGGSVSLGRPVQYQDPGDFDAHPGYPAARIRVKTPDPGATTVLYGTNQFEAVIAAYNALGQAAVTGDWLLMMVLRRVQMTSTRALPEDRLIDLAIAAEALFISHPGLNAPGSKSPKIAEDAADLLTGDPVLAASDENIPPAHHQRVPVPQPRDTHPGASTRPAPARRRTRSEPRRACQRLLPADAASRLAVRDRRKNRDAPDPAVTVPARWREG
ncbi:hypothetical protein ABH935_006637 [Catenulispora sp. GAS73]|uniref:hypothetical protein n=1 Tax=Catenulispora sp. GAS73 TaxID=3156269 RepID=UPI00351920D3